MQKPDKASIRYSIGFVALSIIQTCLIHGLFTTPEGNRIQTDLYMDGADFSPFLTLLDSSVHSFVFEISVFFDILIGIVLSLVIMLILRKKSAHLFASETRRWNIVVTMIGSILFLLISFSFSHFRLILDTCLLYAPIPIVSWLTFHVGKHAGDNT